jgi:SAM-dependent methyltransferase
MNQVSMDQISTLNDWLNTPQGAYLLAREQDFFDRTVVDIFGFNALQLGLPQRAFLQQSRMPLRFNGSHETNAQVRLALEALPFESDSLDLVLLPHILEFSPHPHQILREVERVLRPEGNVIISGFNPHSLWGLRRALGSKAGYPWNGDFIALSRMKDWLALLGFEVVGGSFACYAPAFINPQWLQRCHFMEPAGDRWWAVCGGVYFLQAVKRVHGVHLIRPQWNASLVGKLLPTPASVRKGAAQHTQNEQ